MSPLPNTAQTKVIIGGKPEGDPITLSFQWANDQGKLETKTGTIIGSQTVLTVASDAIDRVLGSSVYTVVDVPNDGSYGIGPGGVIKKVA